MASTLEKSQEDCPENSFFSEGGKSCFPTCGNPFPDAYVCLSLVIRNSSITIGILYRNGVPRLQMQDWFLDGIQNRRGIERSRFDMSTAQWMRQRIQRQNGDVGYQKGVICQFCCEIHCNKILWMFIYLVIERHYIIAIRLIRISSVEYYSPQFWINLFICMEVIFNRTFNLDREIFSKIRCAPGGRYFEIEGNKQRSF